jgi:hypothetical protein
MNNYDFEDHRIDERQQGGKRFNLSALAVREKAITLFLLITVAAAGIFAS